ncbi:hypothetical protein Herbaro_09470 [Herbaspirillum sp. WKF16]|uniref:hypothetical protein n=1 Tax=Herbaspirillum sp. WKF16 TaxID=3028312 RepID=UPI0023A9B198|nr:hypothetical protein [Herbaspirillum sp. WKF16]WDZ97989.1 hypothetical protein Herbaro_09470 [Herbaspirillum sp. WKF16]
MTPDTIVQLGDFEFFRYEVPEKIPFGGEQRLVIHKMVGGKREVQALGADPAPISWSGLFFGETALDRARYVNTLKDTGQEVILLWSEFFYRVVIKEFRADYERFYQIPYQITVEVVEDLSTPVTEIAAANVDDMINEDAINMSGMCDEIGDSELSELMDGLNSAIAAVSDLAKAAQSTINSVLKPLNAVRARVTLLMASVNNTVRNVTTLGGILPNNPIAANAARILGQVNAATRLPILQQLDVVSGRMGKNLGTINSGTKSITMAGGNLYRVAANEYNDAMGWTNIAGANGMVDPVVADVQTVVIPPYNQNTGGVMNA